MHCQLQSFKVFCKIASGLPLHKFFKGHIYTNNWYQDLGNFVHCIFVYIMWGSRWGRGFGPHLPKNTKLKDFLAMLIRIPWKSQSHQACIQCWAIIHPPAKCHLNGVLLAGQWWPALSGIWIPSSILQNKHQKGTFPEKKRNIHDPHMDLLHMYKALQNLYYQKKCIAIRIFFLGKVRNRSMATWKMTQPERDPRISLKQKRTQIHV